MVHLILGYGEVGQALGKVLGKHWYVDRNGSNWNNSVPDVVHICIPYSSEFNTIVEGWALGGSLIIVHSSVPVGTCDKLQVVHSPIRGVHPHLEDGIKTFVKYFGGRGAFRASKIFTKLGIKTRIFEEARVTEALKLWDTTQYGRLIMLEKEIHEWCEKNNLPFEVIYQDANRDYNIGYVQLGRPEVVRPHLNHVEGPIGGHCVNENAKLLGKKL